MVNQIKLQSLQSLPEQHPNLSPFIQSSNSCVCYHRRCLFGWIYGFAVSDRSKFLSLFLYWKCFLPPHPARSLSRYFFKKEEHWRRAVPRWFFKGVKSCSLLWSRHLCYLTSPPWNLDPLWERWGWSNKQLTDHTWIGIKTLGEDFHIKVTRKLDGWLEFLKPPKETNLGVTSQGFSYCLTPKLKETTLQHSIDDGVFFYKCFFTHNLSDRTTLLFGSLPRELGAFKKDQSGIGWLTLYLAPQRVFEKQVKKTIDP